MHAMLSVMANVTLRARVHLTQIFQIVSCHYDLQLYFIYVWLKFKSICIFLFICVFFNKFIEQRRKKIAFLRDFRKIFGYFRNCIINVPAKVL